MWEKQIVETVRGSFEMFTKGSGEPLCITHLYSEFNNLGYYFAEPFVNNFKVYLINLKDAGNSCKANVDEELSMVESVKDIEAIRESIGLKHWGFAGHSSGGMLGLVYAILFSNSLSKLMVGGATATKRYMEDDGSMYSPRNPLNMRIKEILFILKSSDATIEQKRNANRDWTNMSLYKPEKRNEDFGKPSSGKVLTRRKDYFSYNDLLNFEIQKELSKIRNPTFVYCGRHDAQCPLLFSKEISAGIIHSKLYIFEESNHLPYLEEKERFHQMILEFKKIDYRPSM